MFWFTKQNRIDWIFSAKCLYFTLKLIEITIKQNVISFLTLIEKQFNIRNNNVIKSNMIYVFPNPTTGNFKINLANFKSQDAIILIFNNEGRLIYHKKFQEINDNSQLNIDLERNVPGLYNLQVLIDRKIFYQKLIVN